MGGCSVVRNGCDGNVVCLRWDGVGRGSEGVKVDYW